jgi:hypothetical protein
MEPTSNPLGFYISGALLLPAAMFFLAGFASRIKPGSGCSVKSKLIPGLTQLAYVAFFAHDPLSSLRTHTYNIGVLGVISPNFL